MMSEEKKTGLIVLDSETEGQEAKPENREADPAEPAVGKWYWVMDNKIEGE